MKYISTIVASLIFLIATLLLHSCSSDDTSEVISPFPDRAFKMGFTSWNYGPDLEDVDNTYSFIEKNADIYAEHIDDKIPWNAWMNDLELPSAFVTNIEGKAARKIPQHQLLLSVSILNLNRTDLAEDFDGQSPSYDHINDKHIEDAYYKHITYLLGLFDPDYLLIAIEVNEFRLHAEEKWNDYKKLIVNVKNRVKENHPNLPISESITLHNLYEPGAESSEYTTEIIDYMNQMDFASLSFYPFFKNLHTKTEFDDAFSFINSRLNIPIAFAETSHISEDLVIPNLNVSITGSEEEQEVYLSALLENADKHDYEFVIWWAHRDYDELWETFPDELKDIGQIWRDTGLLDENGNSREAFSTWQEYLISE